MLKDKKVVIFDLDGTLIDSIGIWNAIDEELIKGTGTVKLDDIDIGYQFDNFKEMLEYMKNELEE